MNVRIAHPGWHGTFPNVPIEIVAHWKPQKEKAACNREAEDEEELPSDRPFVWEDYYKLYQKQERECIKAAKEKWVLTDGADF